MIVFDRANILGGTRVSGTMLDERFSSFVGRFPMPTRYGLTVGEYARYVKDYLRLDLDLNVVPLSGWKREYTLADIDISWVAPSPNCATLHAAQNYYGTCIFEGTNVSEGRDTIIPFEYIGAPWIDAKSLAERDNVEDVPGVHYCPCWFRPTFSKYTGEQCRGVQLHFTDTASADAELSAFVLLDTI